MKKTNFLKVATLAFALSLTAGVFAVSANMQTTADETTPTSTIVGQNLSLQDNVYVLYAVNFENVLETDETGVLVWTAPQENYVYETANSVLSESGTVDTGKVVYPTFSYNELSAKKMTEVVYASAYVEREGEYYYSPVKKYSILEYAYNKLGKTEAKPSTDENLKNLLTAMLNYGAAAQVYGNYNLDTLATDSFTYVRVENGAFADGFNYGLYKAGTQVTVTANEGYELCSPCPEYVTVCENGEILLTVPTEKTIYEDLFVEEKKCSEGLEFELLDDDTYAVTGIGTCTDTEIVIPAMYDSKAVTQIGDSAFYNNTNIIRVKIPESVTTIGDFAFNRCWRLSDITVNENNSAFKDIEGNLYSKDGTTLVYYAQGKNNTFFTIPNGVENIGPRAFYNEDSLTKIIIPDTVISIGDRAFLGCCLTKVIIPDSVENIGYRAFYCSYNLTSVTIGKGVENIGELAFAECNSLTSVVINDGVTSIGGWGFAACRGLTSIGIPDSVITIGDSAFADCSSLKIDCEAESQPVGWDSNWNPDNKPVAWGCNPRSWGLEYTLLNNGSYSVTGFVSCANKELVIPDVYDEKPVTRIDSNAFEDCSSLTSVVIGNSVTSIGDYAFAYCDSLTSVAIGDGVTTIGSCAFQNCYKLVEVVNNSPNITVEKGSYSNNGGVGYHALGVYNSGDTYVSKLSNDNGYIVYTDGEEKILVDYVGEETDLVLPTYITKINNCAFRECASLTSVEIPDSVTTIGDYAFLGCYKLVEVVNNSPYITVEKGLTSNGFIGLYALEVYNSGDAYVSKLTNDNGYIIYTDGEEKILMGYTGEETDLVLPSYITKIYQYAFEDSSSLTSVVIGDSVTSIGSYAFAYCDYLTSVVIGDGVTLIGQSAFYKCYSLTSVGIGDSVTTISDYTFRECTSLTSVIIGDSVTSIGSYAFAYCDSLTSVNIPDSVASIGGGAFRDCTSLTRVVIPDSVTSIGSWAFYGCFRLGIYCEAESKPSGWSSYWASSNRPVVWGYKAEE